MKKLNLIVMEQLDSYIGKEIYFIHYHSTSSSIPAILYRNIKANGTHYYLLHNDSRFPGSKPSYSTMKKYNKKHSWMFHKEDLSSAGILGLYYNSESTIDDVIKALDNLNGTTGLQKRPRKSKNGPSSSSGTETNS